MMHKIMDDDFIKRLCEYKDIREPCHQCMGLGTYLYSNTATWRRSGMAGQAFTMDICDECWGTGDLSRKGPDLRKMELNMTRRDRADAIKHIAAMLGCSITTVQRLIPHYADTIDALSRKKQVPKDSGLQTDDLFWYRHVTHAFASLLRRLNDIDAIVNDNAHTVDEHHEER